jgi:hypothetical protein
MPVEKKCSLEVGKSATLNTMSSERRGICFTEVKPKSFSPLYDKEILVIGLQPIQNFLSTHKGFLDMIGVRKGPEIFLSI